ncbi:MAG: adenylate/guanylate cyclase domain-containing protein [Dehalococcoidia bacterium]|nr:adenylate/guanylate cyclase domain-containing protein [Dehalococcoidia bacterium]
MAEITANSLPKRGMTRRQRKRLYHTLVLVGVGCLFTLVSLLVQPFYSINLWVSDQLFTSGPPSPNIVIVGIDDDTLEAYGRWAEWRRSLHAQAIDNLAQAGAKVIGYDVIFADDSTDDEILATAIAEADNVVLSAVGIPPVYQTKEGITYDSFLLPVGALEQASSSIGHANVIPDGDGTVRRLPLIVRSSSGQVYPSLTLAVLHRLFTMPLPQDYPLENGVIDLLARDIPVDALYRLRINFSADNAERPYLSYGDIISGNFNPSLVDNKIVLIGMTATGDLDSWAIPTSASKIPGVFIHAGTMDTILRERFLREPGTTVTLMIMLLLVGITAFALPMCGTRNWRDIVKGVGITVGLVIAYLIASFLAFDRGYILDLFYPLLLLPVVYVSNIVYVVITEQADKRFVKELFGRYISPQIANEIVSRADSGQLQLGGEQREVSVFFADIRGFTRISEQLSAEAVMQMLNTYLSVIADEVVRHDGIVNKFVGDNIMAVWNAPQSQPDHALLAVKAAWEAQQKLAELRQRDNRPLPVQFGIGINTGVAVAGNVGSAGRSEYTVIGDSINIASRICSSTPGNEVWIGPETYNQTKDYIEAEKLEPQSVKGKAAPITLYRVTALRPGAIQSKDGS